MHILHLALDVFVDIHLEAVGEGQVAQGLEVLGLEDRPRGNEARAGELDSPEHLLVVCYGGDSGNRSVALLCNDPVLDALVEVFDHLEGHFLVVGAGRASHEVLGRVRVDVAPLEVGGRGGVF